MVNFLLATLTLLAPAPEADPVPAGPPGPSPQMVMASIARDGKLHIAQTRVVAVPEIRQETVVENGVVMQRAITVYKQAPITQTQAVDLKGVRVTDSEGKSVDQATLARKLEKQTPVVLSADGQPVSAVFRSTLKKGTLILQVPQANAGMAGVRIPVNRLPIKN